jgi:hypothetical protein
MKKQILFLPLLLFGAIVFFSFQQDDNWKEIKGWPQASRLAAMEMWKKYGKPQEMTPTMLVWNNNGPWKRTIVFNRESKHSFPVEHTDVMEQTINYKVPTDKFTMLADYDGSVTIHRTDGEMSAKCDKEGANMLALNLANDIITGKKSVAEARMFYANTIKEFALENKTSPYMTAFQFDTSNGATNDKDKLGVSEQENEQIMKKMMEMNQKMLERETGMR